MIEFISKNNAFLLQGETFSYAMMVGKSGFLQHVYFGKKIDEQDLDYLTKQASILSPNEDNINMDTVFGYMPSEYGLFARGDYREPAVIAEREDGCVASRLRYVGYKICKGTPKLEGLPHVRHAEQTLSITLKDDFSSLQVVLNYTVCGNVLARNAELYNAGKGVIQLKRALSFGFELPNDNYNVLRLSGMQLQERMPVTAPLANGITKLQSICGVSSHFMNPFMGILRGECGEDYGECYGVQLCYSGNFLISAENLSNRLPIRVQGGIADMGFSWQLTGGESFVTPQAYLTYSSQGLGEMSRSFASFIRDYIVAPAWVNTPRPVVVNSWETCYFDFDDKKLCALIGEAAKLGVDTFVLDDGWFGKRDDDTSGLGDWFVNENKLQGGLKKLIDCCKRHGLKFGLWFEPEMINEDSDLYRAHPDWAVHIPNVSGVRSRNQLVLDFTRKEIVDAVYDMVADVLNNNDIAYVKWDMNRYLTENFTLSLPAERQGEFMHRYMLGVYNLAERLLAAFPNVFFEGCASGGGRFDAGMMYYFPQIWASDDTDGFERCKIHWGTSICYPLSVISAHVSECPNHHTGRFTPYETRGAIATLGAMGYELDLGKLTEQNKADTIKQVAHYRSIERLILEGDVYRISSPFRSNIFAVMVVNKDKSEGYFVAERIQSFPGDYDRFMRVAGLDPEKRYLLQETGVIATGKALMGAGLLIPKGGDYSSWVWHFKQVKD